MQRPMINFVLWALRGLIGIRFQMMRAAKTWAFVTVNASRTHLAACHGYTRPVPESSSHCHRPIISTARLLKGWAMMQTVWLPRTIAHRFMLAARLLWES